MPGSSNPCILASVDVAQAKLFTGVGVQGSSAVAVGDTAGFYDALSGLTGNLVISAFDVSNPASPTLASTLVTGLVHNESQQCNAAAVGTYPMVTLTNNLLRRRRHNAAACSWVLALIDANTPAQLRVIPTTCRTTSATSCSMATCSMPVTASSVLVFDYTSIVGPLSR